MTLEKILQKLADQCGTRREIAEAKAAILALVPEKKPEIEIYDPEGLRQIEGWNDAIDATLEAFDKESTSSTDQS